MGGFLGFRGLRRSKADVDCVMSVLLSAAPSLPEADEDEGVPVSFGCARYEEWAAVTEADMLR